MRRGFAAWIMEKMGVLFFATGIMVGFFGFLTFERSFEALDSVNKIAEGLVNVIDSACATQFSTQYNLSLTDVDNVSFNATQGGVIVRVDKGAEFAKRALHVNTSTQTISQPRTLRISCANGIASVQKLS